YTAMDIDVDDNDIVLDRKILGDNELKKLFPLYRFYGEEKKHLVDAAEIMVDDSARFYDGKALKPGKYLVELRSMDDTFAVITKEFVVYDDNSKLLPCNPLEWLQLDRKSPLPGEELRFSFGTSFKNVEMWVQLLHNDDVRMEQWVRSGGEVRTLSYKVTEADRGLLTLNIVYVKENAFVSMKREIYVPFDNYALDVRLATVHDRLNPGAEETCDVTVLDYKKQPLEAALLAGMYDASLDAFAQHSWCFDMQPTLIPNPNRGFSTIENEWHISSSRTASFVFKELFDFILPSDMYMIRYAMYFALPEKSSRIVAAASNKVMSMAGKSIETPLYEADAEEMSAMKMREINTDVPSEEEEPLAPAEPTLRENFNETAFFFPQLRTNADGSATFSFTMPDALTRWKLMLLAYTKERQTGYKDDTFTSSKPVMVMADMPRYLYDNDTLWFVANVINTGEEAVTPTARLEIFDAATMQPVSLLLSDAQVPMEQILPGRSQAVRWKVAARHGLELLAFRFTASAGTFSDAEQHLLPVLNSEVFMTQTLPLTVKANSEQTFNFDAIANPGSNERDHSLTLNFSSNPVWYAVQSLPYLAN
ncbi:MAG: hypothetical protein J6X35_00730, partial [Bacteroidales bacterium]|nr:hypothetical protein [Bacteroidales bacterium]